MPRFMIKALLSLVRRIKRTEMNKRKEDWFIDQIWNENTKKESQKKK